MKKYLLSALFSISVHFFSFSQWTSTNYTYNMEVYGLNFLNDSVGFACGYHQVYKTTDGGQNWNEIASNVFINGPKEVWFINENIGFIIGSNGSGYPQVSKTINGGTSWTTNTLSAVMGFNDPNKIIFLNDNVGYICCRSGHIFKTTNQGVVWTELTSGTTEDLTSIHFPSPNVGYATFMYSNSILKTINGGNSWSLVELGQLVAANDLFFTSNDTGFIACANSKIMKTTNGGESWTLFTFGTSDDFYAIDFTSDDIGYVAGSYGTIATTTNAGVSWNSGSGGITQLLYSMDFPSPQVGYIGALGPPGKIIKTTNGGGILSVNEQVKISKFSIFPNPASDQVTVSTDQSPNTNMEITIYNMMGSVVREEAIQQNELQMQIGDLCNGIYLIEIKAKNWTERQKLLIQR